MKRFLSKLLCLTAALSLFTLCLGGAALAIKDEPKAKAAASKSKEVTKSKAVTKSKEAKKAKPKAWVKKVQGKLSAAGFQVKADGLMGPKTRAAIKAFQKKNGLKASGRLNKATKAKLGV